MNRLSVRYLPLAAIAGLLLFPGLSFAQTAPSLGTAETFAVLAGQAVTNTGPSVVSGDLGVSPGSAVTGFPPGIVIGTIHAADVTAAGAQTDVTTAYNDLAGQACDTNISGDLGGLTLVPGVYCASSSIGITGTLTLDAQGDPNAVFVFQVGSSLTTASGSQISLINGAQACNVFWQVGSSATLGTASAFAGNILALTSISATTGATITGRALARNGSATLDTNLISVPTCISGPSCPTISIAPSTAPGGTVGVPYSQAFTASGGTGSYTFTTPVGTPPTNLSLSSAGLLTGTPTTVQVANFTVRATDADSCTGDAPYSVAILAAAPVPTMPQWMMIGLGGLLGLASIKALRRRVARS